ncbi:MAG TPA: VOC family protein [Myxococcota bacterium]|nr:VOC family protein [Myxococcota bacterium]
MIGYVTIGTSDLDKACAFYDALLAEVGAKQLFGMDRIKFYGTGLDGPMLAVCTPYDEKAQDCGNGNMVAIRAEGLEQIKALHKKALELGGTDEGEPGERIPGMFTGAYVRDLDGNKLCFFEMKTG